MGGQKTEQAIKTASLEMIRTVHNVHKIANRCKERNIRRRLFVYQTFMDFQKWSITMPNMAEKTLSSVEMVFHAPKYHFLEGIVDEMVILSGSLNRTA